MIPCFISSCMVKIGFPFGGTKVLTRVSWIGKKLKKLISKKKTTHKQEVKVIGVLLIIQIEWLNINTYSKTLKTLFWRVYIVMICTHHMLRAILILTWDEDLKFKRLELVIKIKRCYGACWQIINIHYEK